jgi:hypothetical protein
MIQRSLLYRIGNGDPHVNGIYRLLLLFFSACAAGLLGMIGFLGQSIYNDVHNLDSQVPSQAAHLQAIDAHLGNLDTNVAQVWTIMGDVRDRMARMETQQSDERRKR